MRLFIAEKPSLARALAEALPGPCTRAKTHIACGDGNVVVWCAGHILKAAPPEAYGADLKSWRLDDLPIAPTAWKLEVSTPELLKTIQFFLRKASSVVHAGDPDREGQLLVDEVLGFLGYEGPVLRLLARDLRPEAVRAQMGALEPNVKFRPLCDSALGRQRADWLYGMNMTRLYTLLGRAAGYEGVLSVGRVQTPLLGLIVARDRAIAAFTPAAHFVLSAVLETHAGATFRADWVPGPEAECDLDEDKRLLRREAAEAARARVEGQRGAVMARTDDAKVEPPPLPYALADLQIDAGRRMGLSAQAVLDACQTLYETYRLTTYPRSDCRHLPEGQHAQASEVLASVGRSAPGLAAFVAQADVTRRSKAWNDAKVTAHHAIIPTPAKGARPQLSNTERAVYDLIARRYIAQFFAPHDVLQTKVELSVEGERFVATGRQIRVLGWKVLAAKESDGAREGAEEGEVDDSARLLPPLGQGDVVTVREARVAEKWTEAPKPFTDASLIAAMCGVAKFVRDARIRKILTESDGIGTPATRAAIIETLFERGYVTRARKSIVSTETGRALIAALPEVATTPDRTALWEAALRGIVDGTQNLDTFLSRVTAELRQLVAQGVAIGRVHVPAAAQPTARSPSSRRQAARNSVVRRPGRTT